MTGKNTVIEPARAFGDRSPYALAFLLVA